MFVPQVPSLKPYHRVWFLHVDPLGPGSSYLVSRFSLLLSSQISVQVPRPEMILSTVYRAPLFPSGSTPACSQWIQALRLLCWEKFKAALEFICGCHFFTPGSSLEPSCLPGKTCLSLSSRTCIELLRTGEGSVLRDLFEEHLHKGEGYCGQLPPV